MQPLHDVSSIQATLRDAVARGLFTLEQLDQPSKGFAANTNPDRAIFPKGYHGVQFRNLLRPDGDTPTQPQTETIPF